MSPAAITAVAATVGLFAIALALTLWSEAGAAVYLAAAVSSIANCF